MRWLLISVLLLANLPAHAGVEVQRFASEEQQARYKTLVNELRCLVCQNQNLADSNAELAQDLRQQTHEMIVRGDTDREIIDYMVARYGDFVLYRPPLKASTVLLWAGPFVFFGIGLGTVILFVRRRKIEIVPGLSEDEQQRARRLMKGEDKDQ